MHASDYDKRYGKKFDFPKFEKDFISVESAGRHIYITISNSNKKVIGDWLLDYPFNSRSNYYNFPTNTDQQISILRSSANEIEIVFDKNCLKYNLTITCTDPDAKEKPITILWI